MPNEAQVIIDWLPKLRGWDEAESLSDWPSGFCSGESDYRKRAIDALQTRSLSLAQELSELRCAVTIKRCSEFGCFDEGATSAPDWQCPPCRIYKMLVPNAHTR